jgi:hypothetical protein
MGNKDTLQAKPDSVDSFEFLLRGGENYSQFREGLVPELNDAGKAYQAFLALVTKTFEGEEVLNNEVVSDDESL